jgi:CubicO group peptidase (beta-lactamase class C family)
MTPIVEFFPELANAGNDDVLVHHLLTHSAGWESELFSGRMLTMFDPGVLAEPPPGRDFLTHLFLSMALDPVRVAPVGTVMAYGNCNYSLLGEIVRRVTGGSLDAAMRTRVFEPLGMERSALIVGDDLRPDLLQRSPDLPFGSDQVPPFFSIQGELMECTDAGEGGVHASPLDLARFGQAILQGGTLDGARILSSSTVRAMCIDQIPGLPASFGEDLVVPVASWGYGFSVLCEQRWPNFAGGLVPPGSVTHPGAGGIDYWIDFEHEIVGVFFEVLTEVSSELEPISGMGNRFQDVITAAVVA